MRHRTFALALAMALATACAQSAFAQSQTTASAEIYLKTTTVLEDVLTLSDGTTTGLVMEYFLSETGNIVDLKLAAINGIQGSFFDAICFTRRGPPKKTICTAFFGSGGNGGGTPSALLSAGPLLLEFATRPGLTSESKLQLEIVLQQMGEDQVRRFLTTVNVVE